MTTMNQFTVSGNLVQMLKSRSSRIPQARFYESVFLSTQAERWRIRQLQILRFSMQKDG